MLRFTLSLPAVVFSAVVFFVCFLPAFLPAQILVPDLPAPPDMPDPMPSPQKPIWPPEDRGERPYMPTVEVPERKKWTKEKSNDIEIVDLRCEHLIDPLAVNTAVPKLSWKIRSKNNIADQKQIEYHIIVAQSEFLLLNNVGGIWDSDYIESGDSEITYDGLKLGSGDGIFYWKVRVLDKDKKSSEWSKTARFAVGLLNASDWKGEWLKCSAAEQPVCFRQHLTLHDKPQSALTYVLSNGDHKLFINGKKAENQGQKPRINVSLPVYAVCSGMLNGGDDKSCPDKLFSENPFLFEPYCAAYNLAPLLQQGKNEISIVYKAMFYSGGVHSGGRAVLLQMNGKTVRGIRFTLHTDSTWQCD